MMGCHAQNKDSTTLRDGQLGGRQERRGVAGQLHREMKGLLWVKAPATSHPSISSTTTIGASMSKVCDRLTRLLGLRSQARTPSCDALYAVLGDVLGGVVVVLFSWPCTRIYTWKNQH